MSIASHDRRLRRLQRLKRPRELTLADLVGQISRERDAEREAALSLVDFAQALAGTDRMRPEPAPPPVVARPAPRATPPRSKGRVWTEDIRPGPRDILTWEEAMKVPWIGGGTSR